MVDNQLEALSVATRRVIYQMLIDRPRAVSEIAASLPVSRPAVSQHLKVLLAADLVQVSRKGNRHIYSADPAGMGVLRDWIDRMWTKAMESFSEFAREQMEARDE